MAELLDEPEAEARLRRVSARLGDLAALAYLDGLEDGERCEAEGLEVDRERAVVYWRRAAQRVARHETERKAT